MPSSRTVTIALTLLALAVPASASAGYKATTPSPGALYHDGQAGRFLMGGQWLFRLDPPGGGLAAGLARKASTAGWSGVPVPYTWNAHENTVEAYTGGVAWYRKDFRLPDRHGGRSWIVRFESINYRATVWLNGHLLGQHTGEFLAFELPARGIRRTGVNRLVVRVDSTHNDTDFPPIRVTDEGAPTGGWWNEGGLNREVYLRRVEGVDLEQVTVSPRLPCPRCPATIHYRALLRSYSAKSVHVSLSASYGKLRRKLGGAVVPAHGSVTVFGTLSVRHPRLWSPDHPHLYQARLDAVAGGRTLASYTTDSGVRSIRVNGDGRLLLNGQAVHFRGVGIHEDSPATGWAIGKPFMRELVSEAQSAGATLLRAHYPLHPYLHELADRKGLLVWSEIPVYGLKVDDIGIPAVRRSAIRALRNNILINGNHPSIAVWSIANELSSRVNARQTAYIKGAVKLAHSLDPTRPVGLAVAGYDGLPCQPGYRPLDIIGFNEYFGWYTGPLGVIADRDQLPAYLDHLRGCYPHQAVVVTEFGAEANRAGPVEEKGTYANQEAFVNFHTAVFATKPWLAGAVYWALREFRVRPGWAGGNPRPQEPLHQKGLISFDGQPKPAFADIQRIFRAVKQYGGGL